MNIETNAEMYYDSEGDILYVTFEKHPHSKGIQLTEEIVVRIDPATQRILKLIVHNYSRWVALSQNGRLPIAVTKLLDMSDFAQSILRALSAQPLGRFLALDTPTADGTPRIVLGEALLPAPASSVA